MRTKYIFIYLNTLYIIIFFEYFYRFQIFFIYDNLYLFQTVLKILAIEKWHIYRLWSEKKFRGKLRLFETMVI